MQNNKLNDERYVLNKKEKEQRHVIKEVYPDSIAEELEIEAGGCAPCNQRSGDTGCL